MLRIPSMTATKKQATSVRKFIAQLYGFNPDGIREAEINYLGVFAGSGNEFVGIDLATPQPRSYFNFRITLPKSASPKDILGYNPRDITGFPAKHGVSFSVNVRRKGKLYAVNLENPVRRTEREGEHGRQLVIYEKLKSYLTDSIHE